MESNTPTTITSWAAAIHRALEARQLPADAILTSVGLDLKLLNDPNGRYPVSAMSALWNKAIRETGDPAFPLAVPAYVQPGTLHGLGLALLASQSIHDASLRLQRFSHIVSDAANVLLHDSFDPHCVEFVPTCEATDAAFVAFLANAIQMIRLMTQQPELKPHSVELRSPTPQDTGPYDQFFGCEVRFGSDRWGLLIERAVMEKPLPSANAMLATANDDVVQAYLARFGNNITRRTRQAIIEHFAAGMPSLEDVAGRLHISARSLQRQLGDTGASFTELRDAVQREMAEQWLKNSGHSLAEITFRLGFSDQSNFSKAFKRWNSQTPGQFRARFQ